MDSEQAKLQRDMQIAAGHGAVAGTFMRGSGLILAIAILLVALKSGVPYLFVE